MKSMYIGSGDVPDLMMGKDTGGHKKFIQRFFSDTTPYYNAFNSPIKALRTGAILEERMLLQMPEGWYPQVRVESKTLDVFRASLDFAYMIDGRVQDFIEMKTMFWDTMPSLEKAIEEGKAEEWVKKNKKNEWKQVQEQLFCTGIIACTMRFVAVYSYDDEENWNRVFAPEDYRDVRIHPDDDFFEQLVERGHPFQQFKDAYIKK